MFISGEIEPIDEFQTSTSSIYNLYFMITSLILLLVSAVDETEEELDESPIGDPELATFDVEPFKSGKFVGY